MNGLHGVRLQQHLSLTSLQTVTKKPKRTLTVNPDNERSVGYRGEYTVDTVDKQVTEFARESLDIIGEFYLSCAGRELDY